MGHPYEVDDKDHELQLALLTIQIHNRAIRILNERGYETRILEDGKIATLKHAEDCSAANDKEHNH